MIFKQAQIDSFIKKNDPSIKTIILYGSNMGMISDYCKKITLSVTPDLYDPFTTSHLIWDDICNDTGKLSSELNSRSLMGDRKVIILKDADNELTKTLKEIMQHSPFDNLLIVCCKSSVKKGSSLLNLSSSDDVASFACYDDKDKDLTASVRNALIERGVTYTNDAFSVLCSRLSNDRLSNLSEIEKLITYVGTKKHIETNDVTAIVFDQAVSGSDDLCFHTFSGNKEASLNHLKHLLNEETEEVTIIRSLTRHVYRLLEGKALIEKGSTPLSAIKTILPKNMFNFHEIGADQLNIWSKNRLFDALDLLYKTEKDCKTTDMPTMEILTYTILSILSAAKKLKK